MSGRGKASLTSSWHLITSPKWVEPRDNKLVPLRDEIFFSAGQEAARGAHWYEEGKRWTSIKVQLPDGSIKEVDRGTTPLQIAEKIGPGCQGSVAAKVDGIVTDLDRPARARREAWRSLRSTHRKVWRCFATAPPT